MTAAVLQVENAVVRAGERFTVRDLAARGQRALAAAPAGAPCALLASDPLDLLAGACALAATRRDGMVVPRERLTPAVLDRLAHEGFALVDVPGERLERAGTGAGTAGLVHLLTSGSTGEPKLLGHTWESLFTMARVREPHPARWLLAYQAGTYAWFQLVTALLFLPGQSLVLPAGTAPAEMVAAAARGGVTAFSTTPTFWRLAMLQADPADLMRLAGTLESVTLGGEPVDQPILDQMRALFPAARLVHIYASSEAGASIVVTDGRAGFPAEWLDDERRSPKIRVDGGTLWLRSPHAAIGLEDWYDTGDIAEIRAGRVHLLGRAGRAMINVGGAKAFAADIERVILEHPYVLWCRVRGVRAPLVGQLIAAEVVPRPERAGEPLPEPELGVFCASRLQAHMVPRIWERLDQIPANENWKTEV